MSNSETGRVVREETAAAYFEKLVTASDNLAAFLRNRERIPELFPEPEKLEKRLIVRSKVLSLMVLGAPEGEKEALRAAAQKLKEESTPRRYGRVMANLSLAQDFVRSQMLVGRHR